MSLFKRKKKADDAVEPSADGAEIIVEEPDGEADTDERRRQRREQEKKALEETRARGKKVKKKADSFWTNFKKFVAKGNVVDLAVAVVVGAAFNKVVSSLVSNIITPLTSRILPKGDFTALKIVLAPAIEADPEKGIAAVAEVAVTYGQFLKDVIDFLVIALTIYFILRIWLKIKDSVRKKERLAAEQKAKEAEEKKKAEAKAEAERLERIKNEFLNDVSVQADVLGEIRDILIRLEKSHQNNV
ncbi:MAG: large conductance mechanosensitive channel protein MscL [Clostridia bacterium]|nr:large conductance mechanosensitive channel protein MscL [Clostridia bacterium]